MEVYGFYFENMSGNVGEFPIIIEPSRCDFNGNAPLTYLCDKALQVATIHAHRNGFGFDVMDSIRKAWVISRMGFYITRYPAHDEHVTYRTWVNSVERLFTRRNFEIIDDNGYSIMQAQSFWAAIDFDTRRPTDLTEMNNGALMPTITPDSEEYNAPRLRKIPAVESQPVFTHKAVYSDIDVNRHFNSVKYIEHALDLYDEELFSGKEVKEMEVVFLNETLAGTNMAFCKENGIVDIKNADNGDSLCRLSFKFS